MCGCINNTTSLVSLYYTSSLINDGYGFLTMNMSCLLINGIMSLEEWRDGQTQLSITILIVSLSLYCHGFYCQVSFFLDHEIMLFPGTGRILWGHQPSHRDRVIIKMSYGYLRKYLLNYMNQDWDLSLRVTVRYTPGPLGNAHSVTLASTWLMI
jgi:hypothetical protein